MNIEKEVFEQTMKFRELLAEIPVELAEKWVVFEGGRIHSTHENSADAYEAAVAQFGIDSPFVVAQVRSVESTPVSAGVCFGLR